MKRIIVGIVIFLVVLVVGAIGYQQIEYHLLGTYTVSDNYRVLTNQNAARYVYMDEDNPMSYQALRMGKHLGKTDEGGIIYEIKGQELHDWIAFEGEGEMSIIQLYHRQNVEPISIAKLKIKELRLIFNRGSQGMMAVTEEPGILKEFSQTIQETAEHNNLKFAYGAELKVISEQLKGIAYLLDVHITGDHQVFIAKINDQNMIKSGNLLGKWILKAFLF